MINTITNRGQTLAIILQTTYKEKGINFSKLKEFSQQLAYMNRPSGYEIQPHVHNAVQREVQFSKEVLFQAGNAVILIDPDDSNSIADAMKSMLDESISKKIKNGYKRLKQISLIRKNSEKILITKLLQFEKNCNDWGIRDATFTETK